MTIGGAGRAGPKGLVRGAGPKATGDLVYGPYMPLAPGTYRVVRRLRVDPATVTKPDAAILVAGVRVGGGGDLSKLEVSLAVLGADPRAAVLVEEFQVPGEGLSGGLEFPIWVSGNGQVDLLGYSVEPIETLSARTRPALGVQRGPAADWSKPGIVSDPAKEGLFSFGPYATLKPGRYVVSYRFAADVLAPPDGEWGALRVTSGFGAKVHSEVPLRVTDLLPGPDGVRTYQNAFSLDAEASAVEFVIMTRKGAMMQILDLAFGPAP
jgi:hypothetical protein